MALSNWDTYALLIEVERDAPPVITPCNGVMESTDSSSTLSIYKNCASISIKHTAEDSEDYIGLEYGEVNTNEFSVRAIKDRHDTLYLLASSYDYENEKYGYLVGIGCYGYQSGVIAKIFRSISDISISTPEVWKFNWWIFNTFNRLYNKCDTKYVGTTRKMIRKLRKFVLKEMKYSNEWWRNIDFYQGLRFNQGDAYFANALNTEIPATQLEDQEEPVMSTGLRNMVDKKEPEDE